MLSSEVLSNIPQIKNLLNISQNIQQHTLPTINAVSQRITTHKSIFQ
jgi:hypothetical protein